MVSCASRKSRDNYSRRIRTEGHFNFTYIINVPIAAIVLSILSGDPDPDLDCGYQEALIAKSALIRINAKGEI